LRISHRSPDGPQRRRPRSSRGGSRHGRVAQQVSPIDLLHVVFPDGSSVLMNTTSTFAIPSTRSSSRTTSTLLRPVGASSTAGQYPPFRSPRATSPRASNVRSTATSAPGVPARLTSRWIKSPLVCCIPTRSRSLGRTLRSRSLPRPSPGARPRASSDPHRRIQGSHA
ncbi:MAG: hypothetical protein ACI8WY_002216, partial [Planctomycetota bacterium]